MGEALARRPIFLALLLVQPVVSLVHVVQMGGAWLADGLPVGWDFAVFLTGARVLELDASRLYDFDFQASVEHAWRAGAYHSFPFISPPFVAVAFVPLAHLPYVASLVGWSLAGIAAATFALQWGVEGAASRGPWRNVLLLVGFPPIVFALIAGQSTLLTFALMALVYGFARRERWVHAGIACALMMIKPQCVLGLLVFFIVRLRGRDALRFWGAFVAVGLGLAGVGYAASPAATRAYFHLAVADLPSLQLAHFDRTQIQTWRAFFMLALPQSPRVAEALAAAVVLLGVGFSVWFWRRRNKPFLYDYSLAIALGLWCAPHGYIYDWTVLAIPMFLVWEHVPGKRGEWTALFALSALVLVASDTVSSAAQSHLGASMQPSLLLLAALPFVVWRVSDEPLERAR